jgi:serine/threonine protein kinase/TPR repeat protein
MPEAERYQQYEVLRRADGSLWELGRGAMGTTYKAFDTNLRFTVALKVINSAYLQNETARQRFLREARAAAALRHPNVASVFNLGTDQSNYFYVMEFVDGETVEALVQRKGSLEPIEALNITQQVARALGAAAKQRLVHRDLKPSNLMLVDDEGESVVKVIDFGLAKSSKDSNEDTAALTVGGFVGTPHFASPEQVEEGELDVRSDIYSLGATLYFMLTGKAPFSGSVGQVMSQHLYKPISVEPLADVPQCVIVLTQSMLEKDRTKRPQTPRALQDAITACLDQIRDGSTRSTAETTEEEPEVLVPGALLGRQYRLVEELGEIQQGQHFLADDLRRLRLVRLLVLRPDFASEPHWFALLQLAVDRVRNAPHPMLRAVYSLETAGSHSILVEENIVGPSLQDVLRSRSVLSPPEAVFLASLLAQIADHASTNKLEHLDFSLLGIHFVAGDARTGDDVPDLLSQPLTDWERVEPKVSGIDFSFTPSQATTLTGFGTQLQHAGGAGPRGSYMRSLSLLVYELLGGPRTQVEATGRYTPIAALTQDGNVVLRRGLVDDFSSATEMVERLAAIVDTTKSATRTRDSQGSQPGETDRIIPEQTEPSPVGAKSKKQEHATQEPSFQTAPREVSTAVTSTRTPIPRVLVLILAAAISFCVGIVAYLFYHQLGPPKEEPSTKIAELSIFTDPPGASILLDGKPPQSPGTFTDVPFGTHQLTATLNEYESIKQDIEVQKGMAPEIHLKLKPIQEIAALSVQTDPPGASILLDGKPPQSPNTFTHVPFGTHQLTATLNDYEPIKQDIVVQKGMTPEAHLKLKPSQEIAALSVQTDPPGASILLDGKPPQSANTFAHVPFGTHQLTATLNDYESIKQDILVQKGMAPAIRLKLKPTQEIAALSVQSDPAGATILLDGKPPQSPNTFAHVPFGTHQLTATLNDYESIKQDIEVRKGMAPEISLKLKPIQEIAALSVQTDPPGASILLDGKPPQSPNTFTHVPFGTHQLTATLNDYESIKQNIEVRKGMVPAVSLKLKPIQEIAALSVQSDPVGAVILLDGKPPQSPNTFTHVPFGTHQLTATLNDYESIKQDIEVRKGMVPAVSLKLKPIQEIAALSVQTDPPGASILLDGNPPQSPNTFAHVPFGTHQLTASLNDYEPIKQDIEVRKGMAPEISLKLKPIQEIGALSVQTDPPGASILLDGKPPQSPNTFTHVPFGTHQLTGTLNDYEPIKEDIVIKKGIAPEILLKLKPTQEIAALSVQTDPPGASILLDGKPPESPNTFAHVPFGTHQLTATLDEYEAINQEIQVVKGMPSAIHLTLKPKSSPSDGLLAEAKKYGQGTPEQVTAMVRLVQFCTSSKTPDAEEHTKELAGIIEQLRTKTPPFSKDEFSVAYKASIKDAADLNILPAILWLAENEKGRESFDLFLRAANLGDAYAMMNVGKLYLYKGTAADDVQGFSWLKRAYESAKPNLEAGAYLGFCYLHGRGTKKDANEGKKITLSLANQNVVFAMTNAGLLFAEEAQEKREKAQNSAIQTRRQLTAEADALEVQARQWWERAAEKNDWNASARLGQFYQAGLGGLTKSDEQAERLYQEGVKHENTLSKYYYASFLLEKKPDRRAEAEDLMSQAATAGVSSARIWCEQNHVKFNKAGPDDEQ